jgi:hypothetical protein
MEIPLTGVAPLNRTLDVLLEGSVRFFLTDPLARPWATILLRRPNHKQHHMLKHPRLVNLCLRRPASQARVVQPRLAHAELRRGYALTSTSD